MSIMTQSFPVGFRFRPTHKEILDYYLKLRNQGLNFCDVVPDIDVTRLGPREVPREFEDSLSFQGNDNEWWFFSARTRNQRTTRKTGSGKWSSTCKDKKIKGEENTGIMKTFAFHSGQGQTYTRLKDWILHEYHLEDDYHDGLPFPTDKFFVLCHLAKTITDGEVGQSDFFENGEISSGAQQRQRKRTMVSFEIPFQSVDQDRIFAALEQQRHPRGDFACTARGQAEWEDIFGSPQPFVEPFGSNSLTVEHSRGSRGGSGSNGFVGTNGDVFSHLPVEQSPIFCYDEQMQGGLVRNGSVSINQDPGVFRNRRTQSARSLSGVVPAEAKETSVENRNVRIVEEHPAAANPPWRKNSTVKIEEDEKLAQETEEKLRLESRPRLISQNRNSLPFPRSTYLANVAVGCLMMYLICWQMLYL